LLPTPEKPPTPPNDTKFFWSFKPASVGMFLALVVATTRARTNKIIHLLAISLPLTRNVILYI
jgi:hypothetical protein